MVYCYFFIFVPLNWQLIHNIYIYWNCLAFIPWTMFGEMEMIKTI